MYGNGASVNYSYDSADRIIAKGYNGSNRFSYLYDVRGNLTKKTDQLNNITYAYRYDFNGRSTGITGSNGFKQSFEYDTKNRLSYYINQISGISKKIQYVYGDSSISTQKAGNIYGIKLNDTQSLTYEYDRFSRLSGKRLDQANNYRINYRYDRGANNAGTGKTTAMLASVTNGSNSIGYIPIALIGRHWLWRAAYQSAGKTSKQINDSGKTRKELLNWIAEISPRKKTTKTILVFYKFSLLPEYICVVLAIVGCFTAQLNGLLNTVGVAIPGIIFATGIAGAILEKIYRRSSSAR